MKTALVLLAMVLLAGCSSMIGALPTVKYCNHVKYKRNGNKANIEAKDCILPMGTDLPGI